MQTAGLQQDAEDSASSLVVGSFIAPEVGLIRGPVNGVQLTPQHTLQAFKALPPLQHGRAGVPVLPCLQPAAVIGKLLMLLCGMQNNDYT